MLIIRITVSKKGKEGTYGDSTVQSIFGGG